MRISKLPIQTQITAKTIENSSGEEFERYAQFFLLLIYKDYKKTRLHKDEGIDGYRTLKSKTGKHTYEYFSIYGPEKRTSWQNHLRKIKKDFIAILNDSINKDSIISKWYLVTNFGFTKQQENDVQQLKDALLKEYFNSDELSNSIEFEWYYPEKMIANLDYEDKIFQMTAFTNGLPIPTVELTDLHYHKFAQEVLYLLTQHESSPLSTTTKKLDLVNDIYKSLLFYIPMKEYLSEKTSIKKGYKLKKLLKNNTRIYSLDGVYVHKYVFKIRNFLTYNLSQAEDQHLLYEPIIESDIQHGFILRIEDLSAIYHIITFLRSTLFTDGSFSVSEALQDLYLEEHRRQIQLERTNLIMHLNI